MNTKKSILDIRTEHLLVSELVPVDMVCNFTCAGTLLRKGKTRNLNILLCLESSYRQFGIH